MAGPRTFFLSTLWVLSAAWASAAVPATAQFSQLWGRGGEKWQASGRLPDFSRAGYHSGKAAIPTPPQRASVKDFGAKGDGATDDTDAFLAGIRAVENGALYVPPGRYVIRRVLPIRKSRFVLRGAGAGKTTLVIPANLVDVLGKKPGTGEDGNWSWAGGFLWVEGRETNRKIASVASGASRGDTALQVDTTAGLAVGQTVRLVMRDRDGTLGRHLHADQLEMHPHLKGRVLVRFPVRVAAIEGNLVRIDRPLRVDVRREWSPEIHSVQVQGQEVGVEGLRVEFPETPYPGHYREVGTNAIWMENVWNSWVRDVEVVNADNGILLENATFCTVTKVRISAGEKRYRATARGLHTGRHSGHHGIQIRGGGDCMVSYFDIQTRLHHDLTVENTSGNVFMKGRGQDICFDHHTYMPYENLFTEIDIGEGTRPWLSNGSAGPEAGARATFWNLKTRVPVASITTRKGTWPQINLIGVPTTLPPVLKGDGPWIEPTRPGALYPSNLYLAQFETLPRK